MSNRRRSTDSSSYNSSDPSGFDNESVRTSRSNSTISSLSAPHNQQTQVGDTSNIISSLNETNYQQGPYSDASNNTSSTSEVTDDGSYNTSSTSTVTSISDLGGNGHQQFPNGHPPYYMPRGLRNMMMDGNNTSNHNQPTTALEILTSSTTLPPQQQPNLTNFTTYTIDNGLITFNEPFTVRLPLVIYSLSGSTPQNYVVNANTYTILSDTPTRVIDNVVYGSRMIDLRDPNYNLIQYYSRDGYRERISAYELVPSLLNDLSQIVNELDYLRHNNLRP